MSDPNTAHIIEIKSYLARLDERTQRIDTMLVGRDGNSGVAARVDELEDSVKDFRSQLKGIRRVGAFLLFLGSCLGWAYDHIFPRG